MNVVARGYVVFEGFSPWNPNVPILGIVTMQSTNAKTGNMAQLWIIARDVKPTVALAYGLDAAVCGDCPLRGIFGENRACYVNLGKAPTAVWDGFHRGIYPNATADYVADLLRDGHIRLGAYGDPTMLPFELVSALTAHVKGWTGYTHQWRTVAPEWAGLLMASCDNVAAQGEAESHGWRCFTLAANGTRPTRGAECMATRARGRKLQCVDCLACGGTRKGATAGAVSIYIAPHGVGARHALALA